MEVWEVSYKDSRKFLEENHIKGDCISQIRLGLYHNGELVSLMTFRKGYSLLRFCNKLNLNIINGARRLLQFFVKAYKPDRLVSYVDRSWTMGNGDTIYDRLGFELIGKTSPNYLFINRNKRWHSLKSCTNKFIKKIYNSGNLHYVINT